MKENGIPIFGIQQIAHILSLFSGDLPSLAGGETVQRRFAEKFAAHGVVLTLPDETGPAAFAAFYCNDIQTKRAYLSMLAVRPACRKMGYGRKMLEEVFAYCRRKGMQTLTLEVVRDNRAAIALYQKMGFSPTGEETPRSLFLIVRLETVKGD